MRIDSCLLFSLDAQILMDWRLRIQYLYHDVESGWRRQGKRRVFFCFGFAAAASLLLLLFWLSSSMNKDDPGSSSSSLLLIIRG
jgi:hypothetical protein